MRDLQNIFNDKYNYVSLSFYVYGIAGLMPWNFYITPENYWNDKLATNTTLGDDESVPQNWMQNFWQNFLSILCTGVVFLVSILLQARPKSCTKETILTIGISSSVVLFILTAILGIFDNTGWETSFFWANLAVGTTLNAFTSTVQNMGMAMAGGLGEVYIRNLSSGQGFAGIFAALAYIVNLAIAESSTTAGISFFCTAASFALLTLVNHLVVIRTNFYKGKMMTEPTSKTSEAELVSSGVNTESSSESEISILKSIHAELYMVFVTLFVTLSVFPGVAASVRSISNNPEFAEKWFVPVCTFLIYNIGDTVGRLLTNFIQFPSRDSKISIYLISSLRLIFVLLFPLCNVPRMPGSSIPTLISSDIGYALIVLLLAISNGYFTTMSFIYAPQRLEDSFDKAKSEEYVFIALTFGLITGSAASFGVKAATLYL